MADGEAIQVNRFGRGNDGELYAETRVYVPARDSDAQPGERLPKRAGLWRLAAIAGGVPEEASPIDQHDYEAAVGARLIASAGILADAVAAEQQALADAADQLRRLGIPDQLIAVMVPGRIQ